VKDTITVLMGLLPGRGGELGGRRQTSGQLLVALRGNGGITIKRHST